MKNIINRQNPTNQGFTLLEVIIAIAILTIGILSLCSMHVASINGNASASNMTIGGNWASDRIEILLGRPYDHPDLEDDNGDGTNKDTDNNGSDDKGGDFGLNGGLIFNAAGLLTGVKKAAADGRATSPDNRYTILWNVAIDTPVPNCKTIRVIVTSQERGVIKTIPLTYIKSEQI